MIPQLPTGIRIANRCLLLAVLMSSLISCYSSESLQLEFRSETPDGSEPSAQALDAGSLLPNATIPGAGSVLVAGGLDANGQPTSTAEIYDAASDTFSPASHAMNVHRAFHTATLLGNGTVLIAGGTIDNNLTKGLTTTTAEIYDPGTELFTPTSGSMTTSRAFHTATLLENGFVLLAGGDNALFAGVDSTAGADLYDPNATTFMSLGTMVEPRFMHSATLLADGTVLIAGGLNGSAVFINDGSLAGVFGTLSKGAEIYDPVAKTFTCVGGKDPLSPLCHESMTHPRAGHVAIRFPSGPLANEVVLAGGFGGSTSHKKAKPTNSAELYDPATHGFTVTGKMKKARGMPLGVLLP